MSMGKGGLRWFWFPRTKYGRRFRASVVSGWLHERDETMLVTCPRHLVAFGYCGRGGAEDLFVGFPGETFDIVRRGSLFGEPMIVRLAIHADGTVTLTDILADMRERDAFSRW
jgi:hypothetical protein